MRPSLFSLNIEELTRPPRNNILIIEQYGLIFIAELTAVWVHDQFYNGDDAR